MCHAPCDLFETKDAKALANAAFRPTFAEADATPKIACFETQFTVQYLQAYLHLSIDIKFTMLQSLIAVLFQEEQNSVSASCTWLRFITSVEREYSRTRTRALSMRKPRIFLNCYVSYGMSWGLIL